MATEFNGTARRLGVCSAAGVAVLLSAYALTLAAGLLSLESPEQPIGDPLFGLLEVLILALMPLMVTLMAVVHAWAPPQAKALSLCALVFMGLLAGVTSSLHFVLLTVSRHPAFEGEPWRPLLFAFEWPSVAYALDILSWDVFFPLSMLCAAPAFRGSRLATWIRQLLRASALLALAGLSGVATGDMRLRNIGILGYVGGFLVVAVLLAFLFRRTTPGES